MNKRILNLILYNANVAYEADMKMYLTAYLKTVPHVSFYFYCYREQEAEVVIDGHDMFIQGKEGWMPHILRKTMIAIHHSIMELPHFDYLIRSNISTAINYANFPYEELSNKDFATTWAFTLNWLSPEHGVPDQRLFGLRFASGTNIILSRAAAMFLSTHRLEVDESVQDDVAIGELLSHSPYRLYQLTNFMRYKSDSPIIGFTYRHKSNNRNHDALLMRDLLSRFQSL